MSLQRLSPRCACALIALTGASLGAQGRSAPLRLLYHTAWTNRDGAPADIVGVTQTDDGYLWLGTTTGLFRFDGVRFEAYVPPLGQRLPSRNISALKSLPGGPLWVGLRFGGTSAISDGRITSYGEREGFPPGTAHDFARDSSGSTWAATSAGLARLVNGRWTRVGPERGFDGVLSTALFVDRRGTLWVADEKGVFTLARNTTTFTRWGPSLGYNDAGSIQEAADGAVWGASLTRGTIQLTDSSGKRLERVRSVGPRAGLSLLIATDASAWVSTPDGIARGPLTSASPNREFTSAWQSMNAAEGLSGRRVISMFEDREGDVWLGTAGGLDRFRTTKLAPLAAPTELLGPAIAAGDSGALWVGSAGDSLARVQTGMRAFARTPGGVECAYRDLEGALWFGGGSTLWQLSHDRLVTTVLPPTVVGRGVQAIARDRSGVLWVSTVRRGVFRRQSASWTAAPAPPGMADLPAIVAVADSSGRVWLGYTDSRLVLHENGSVRLLSDTTGLRIGNVTAVHVRGAHVWIGGELGLARWDGARVHPVATTSSAGYSGVSGIVETAEGDLWLNSAVGVIRIPAPEIRRLLRDTSYAVRDERFDYRDGIVGVAPQIRPLPSAVQGTDGRLWFTMGVGVVSVDPRQIPRNHHRPPVHISSVRAGNPDFDVGPAARLPPGTQDLHFTYTALSYVNPDRIRFRYRLVGSDRQWQEAGGRRDAFYTNLGPGTYRFQVIAANEDGYWSEDGVTRELIIPPTFVQSRLFLLCVVTAIGLALWWLARMRSRQLMRAIESRFEATLLERTRIAQELHDTLLQGFAGVGLQLHALDAQLRARMDGAGDTLGRIITQVEDTLKDARRMVWDLRAPELDELGLPDALAAAAREAIGEQPISFTRGVSGERRRLARPVEVAAFRIVREGIFNCVRHSHCRAMHLQIDYSSNALRLVLRDDGHGFSAVESDAARRSGHWGIVGMRERAAAVGGTTDISSAPGEGTTVSIVLPCASLG